MVRVVDGGAEVTDWAYIGRNTIPLKRFPQIGTAVCVVIDSPVGAKHTSLQVADWIRDGMTIERVPVEWVRKHLGTTEQYRPETEAPK